MPKRRIASTKALIKELQSVAQDSPSALSLKVGGASYVVDPNGVYVGTISGERYAALVMDDHVLIFEIDRRAAPKALKIISNNGAKIEVQKAVEIAADLLPPPEPPQEVKQAHQVLGSLPKLPKGWSYAIDGRGSVTVAEDGAEVRNGQAPRPQASASTAPKDTNPQVAKGMKLVRTKDGHTYEITKVDAALKKVMFKPIGEGDPNLAATYPATAFWKNWRTSNGGMDGGG